MRALIGLAAVLHVRLCTAEAECSDSLACGRASSSLMQMKSVNTKQSNDGSMHSTLMYFQTFTEKLVNQFNARRARQDPYANNNVVDVASSGLTGGLDDATVTDGSSNSDSAQYDWKTMSTVRDVMDTIRETLLGALLQNLDTALTRVGQCQLIEAYDGTQLVGHTGYHVGYLDGLQVRKMRKRLTVTGANAQATHIVGQNLGVGSQVEFEHQGVSRTGQITAIDTAAQTYTVTSPADQNGNAVVTVDKTASELVDARERIGIGGLTFEQRKIVATEGFKTVHQFCWDETFRDADTQEESDLGKLDTLWETSETKRGQHKTCREKRVTECVHTGPDDCDAYDNFRWYDPNARLEYTDNICQINGAAAAHADVFMTHLDATVDATVRDMEKCLRTTKSWLEALYTSYKKCNRGGTDHCTDAKARCDAHQHDFEVARCWWAVDHDYHCTSYEHCVKSRFSYCADVCSNTDDFLASSRRDYETGETIQCLLEALFGQYNPAYTGETGIVVADQNTWPLIPRSDNDDEKANWLSFCKGALSLSWEDVNTRLYHGVESDNPFPRGSHSTLNFNTNILQYEAQFFQVRCNKGNKMRGARTAVPTPTDDHAGEYEDCSGDACYEEVGCCNNVGNPPELEFGCQAVDTSPACAGAGVGYPFKLLHTKFRADSYANPNENVGADKYNLWPSKSSLFVGAAGSTRPSANSGENTMGTLLHLTYISKLYAPGGGSYDSTKTYVDGSALSWRTRLFDCSEEPVPGEWGDCLATPPDSDQTEPAKTSQESQKLTSWPHYECFADVYRVDSLRTDVPACDMDVSYSHEGTEKTAATYFLSHASLFELGLQPQPLGCAGASTLSAAGRRGAAWITEADKTTGVDGAATASGSQAYAGVQCDEIGHSGDYTNNNDDSLYGTCCAQSTMFYEPMPSGVLPQTEYDCQNHYMFTHHERELAFGLKGAENAFHADTRADTHGYWKAPRHDLVATRHQDSTASLLTATAGEFFLTADAEENKSPWSLSSDIQGAYKVVATTASLGTACEFRHHDNLSDKYKGNYNGANSVFESGHNMLTGTGAGATANHRYTS